MKDSVSYEKLFTIVGDFRKENNLRFDKIETIFNGFHKEEFEPLEKRMTSLEKLADKALLVVGIISAGIALIIQIPIAWIKKGLNL